MIDHISFAVNDFDRSINFYDQTLSILGYKRLMTFDLEGSQVAGYGNNNKPSFWISQDKNLTHNKEHVGHARGLHVSFVATDAGKIKEWHKKCLELGGQDNGLPGPRREYHPGYYGGFIVDPDGWRIEACLQDFAGE